jgi:ABC-type dipeptide/oligopeptide/nickel transport system ATPase subunit
VVQPFYNKPNGDPNAILENDENDQDDESNDKSRFDSFLHIIQNKMPDLNPKIPVEQLLSFSIDLKEIGRKKKEKLQKVLGLSNSVRKRILEKFKDTERDVLLKK